MKELLKKNISVLKLEKNVKESLMENGIDTILKLCNCDRMQLASLNFTNVQINEIIVSLQLMGLDLKKNHARKNTLIDSMI